MSYRECLSVGVRSRRRWRRIADDLSRASVCRWLSAAAVLAVICCVPCAAEGGAEVLVLPGAIGPYQPGQNVKVRIYLRQNPAVAIRAIRQLRFDFTNSDPLLAFEPCEGCQTFCNVVEPFFSFRECLIGGEQADPGAHTQTVPQNDLREFPPELTYNGNTTNVIQQILLPVAGCLDPTPTSTELLCLPVARFNVQMPDRPGTFLLDVLNAADPDPSTGATLEYGFQPPDNPTDPLTVWTAFAGELSNGQVLVSVVCDNDADCDDDNPCTDDSCSNSICSNANNSNPCNDGQFCTTNDACIDGVCGGPSFCPILCDEQGDLCVTCLDDTDCGDGVACTTDLCVDGNCVNTPDQPGCAGCNPNGPSCCETHATPGCNDETCCQLVCGIDPSCCDAATGEWDIGCTFLASAVCDSGTDCNNNCRNDADDLLFGSSADCDGNGIPDECDIDACDGLASCGDCNLNGSPDICDDPLDALPDACVVPLSGSDWSQNIWGLTGMKPYPDDLEGISGLRVTLSATDNLLLDVDVEIPTLRLIGGATLRLTKLGAGDLTITEPGGAVVEGPSGPGRGLVASNDRRINIINGPLEITQGGRFGPPVLQGVAASDVDSHTCTKGLEINDKNGTRASVYELRGESTLYVDGDILVDGSDATTCEPQADVAGVPCVPPIKRTQERAKVRVTGDLRFFERVAIENGSGAAMLVGGDIANESICPSRFSFSCGSVTFASPEFVRCTEEALACGVPPCSDGPTVAFDVIAQHRMEVAGIDFGPVLEGFGLRNATSQNFAMGAITVMAGSNLEFGDAVQNSQGQLVAGTRPEEALYVKSFTIEPGASYSITSGFVYYLRASGIENCTAGCNRLVAVTCDGPNQDGFCNLADFNDDKVGFRTCLNTGPDGPIDAGCESFNYACDDHIDLKDVAVFMTALGGEKQ